jgi:hypothetical protein
METTCWHRAWAGYGAPTLRRAFGRPRNNPAESPIGALWRLTDGSYQVRAWQQRDGSYAVTTQIVPREAVRLVATWADVCSYEVVTA